MKRGALVVAVILAIAAIVAVLGRKAGPDVTPAPVEPPEVIREQTPLLPPAPIVSALPASPSVATVAPVRSMAPSTSPKPSTSNAPADEPSRPLVAAPAVSVESIHTTIQQYGLTYNGNPVGTNAEITAALNGDNPKHIQFLNGEDGNIINSHRELTDPWGSPYFFHQLSAREMEVHSAGPDRIMYTDDDVISR